MSGDERLSWRDAVRFWWHSIVAHRAHAQDIYYDVSAAVVRCGACGRSWGDR